MPIREGLFDGCVSVERKSCWQGSEGPHVWRDPPGTGEGTAELCSVAAPASEAAGRGMVSSEQQEQQKSSGNTA